MSCIQRGEFYPTNGIRFWIRRCGVGLLDGGSSMSFGILPIQGAREQTLPPAPPSDTPREGSRQVPVQFLEGLRVFTEDELDEYDITRYQVTKFYREQIEKSGAYEQLKHIVEQSLQQLLSP